MVRQFLIKQGMCIILAAALGIFLIGSKCSNSMKSTSMNKENDRLQKVIERDANKHIVKTYDGFIYRIFDTLGRQIAWYGNYNNSEGHSNVHKLVDYSDSVITAREYVLEDNNKECKIINSFDCSLAKYYYKNKKLYKSEYYMKVLSDNKMAIGHQLVETNNSPKLNPYLFSLPSYLK